MTTDNGGKAALSEGAGAVLPLAGGACWRLEDGRHDQKHWFLYDGDGELMRAADQFEQELIDAALSTGRERCAVVVHDLLDEIEAAHGNRAGQYHEGRRAALEEAERRLRAPTA